MLRRVVLLSALLALGLPAGAVALPPPEVFLEVPGAAPVPADGAQLAWMGSVDVLIRVRPGDPPRGDGTNRNYVRFAITARPAGQPFEPGLQCESAVAPAGELARVGNVNFAGTGRYTVRVVASTAAEWGSAPECPTDPAAAVSWTNDPIPTNSFPEPVNLIGISDGSSRGGLAIGMPPGVGTRAIGAESSCGLGGTYAGEGRFTGATRTFLEVAQAFGGVSSLEFPEPGRWTCATRLAEENDAGFTRWSEPATGDLSQAAYFTTRLRFGGRATLSGALVAAAAGSTVEVRVKPSTLRPRPRLRRAFVVRAVVGPAGKFSLPIRMRSAGCYELGVRVRGNQYVLPGSMRLIARFRGGRLRTANARTCS